ncbi:TfoX/Sxy family DNA transformation protein [Thioclava sp.]|uniref:TfoX/Sxy family DNA transformation protein n=1 Tax=Thioclava sp. TaxID=1933450 RepID=UPI003AA7C99B
MSDEITSISGLGPASAQGFARAGITSARQLRALGAHEAYRAWLTAGNFAHFIGYYALHMSLQGRPWNDCRGSEKANLRKSFDALCAEVKAALPPTDKGRTQLDAALDEIGLREKR